MTRQEEKQKAAEDYIKSEAVGIGNEVLAFGDFLNGADWADKTMIEKACDAYCKICGHYPHTVPIHICRHDCDYFSNFKEAMKGE